MNFSLINIFIIHLLYIITNGKIKHFISEEKSDILEIPLYLDRDNFYKLKLALKPESSLKFSNIPMIIDTNSINILLKPKFLELNAKYSSLLTTIFFSDEIIFHNQNVQIIKSNENIDLNNYYGILGLSNFNEVNNDYLNVLKILEEMKSKNIIKKKCYSLYISQSNSNINYLIIGGYNKTLYNKMDQHLTVKKVPNSKNMEFVIQSLVYVYSNQIIIDIKMEQSLTGIINSTSSLIELPLFQYQTLIVVLKRIYKTCDSQIIDGQALLVCLDDYSFLQSNFPLIILKIDNNKEITIKPSTVLNKCIKAVNNKNICFYNIGLSNNQNIILGIPFLKTSYSLFDFEDENLEFSYNFVDLFDYFGDEEWFYTFYALLIIWGLSMVACGLYFRTYLERLNKLTNRITKIFYDKIKNRIQGQPNDNDELEDSDEDSVDNHNVNNNNNNINH